MFLALKEIKKEKFRSGLIIGMVIMISYLLFILMGMMLGLANENRSAIDSWGIKTVYLNKDANDSLSQSIITKDQVSRPLNHHEAYVGQTPLVVATSKGHHKTSAQFIGLDRQQFIFSHQLNLTSGHRARNSHQLVVDEGLKNKGYHLGSKVQLNSLSGTYRIVGFVNNSELNVAPVVYGDLSTWRQLRGLNNQVIASGIVSKTAKTAHFSKLAAYPKEKFINKLPGYSAQNSTFSFMIGFLMIISLAVIAVFLYILTMQKIPNYAVLRAQGIPAKYLVQSTIAHAAILMISGTVGGLILTVLTQVALPNGVPMLMNWKVVVALAVGLVALGMVGALLSVRMIIKIDPVRAMNN